jgi:hypothetical protein
MKVFIIFYLLCGSLYAADSTNSASNYRRLVEVNFAADDMQPTQQFHIVMTFWISEKGKGNDRWVYDWAAQGGESPCPDGETKAKKCKELLKALSQPKVLPESPNQIVTVKCADEDKWIIRRFPIDKVPVEVHQILTIMGVHDKEFNRLKFIKNPSNKWPNPN